MRGLGSEKIVRTCTTGCSEFYAISDFYGATTIENSIDAKCVFNVFHEICQVNADQPTKSQPNTPDTSEIGSQGSTPAAR